MQEDTERRTGMYTSVHEDSSTVSTKQVSFAVEFRKRSIDFINIFFRIE
nr:palindromic element RPE1 domain-containing protein [Legionella steigerwaltii]